VRPTMNNTIPEAVAPDQHPGGQDVQPKGPASVPWLLVLLVAALLFTGKR